MTASGTKVLGRGTFVPEFRNFRNSCDGCFSEATVLSPSLPLLYSSLLLLDLSPFYSPTVRLFLLYWKGISTGIIHLVHYIIHVVDYIIHLVDYTIHIINYGIYVVYWLMFTEAAVSLLLSESEGQIFLASARGDLPTHLNRKNPVV